MIWAVIVNGLSGESLGPVARSTTACIAGVTLIVFGLRRKEPNTSLIGLLLILFGAMYYGAANEVWKLAFVASIFQLVSYIGISHDAQRRRPRERTRSQYLLLLLLLLISTVVVLTTPWKLPGILNRDNAQISTLVSSADITPPWSASQTATAPIPTTTTMPRTTTTKPATTNSSPQTTTTTTKPVVVKRPKEDQESRLWLWILMILLVVSFGIIARLMFVKIMNRSLFQKLPSQDNRVSIRFSWIWTRARLEQFGYGTTASVSVDRVSTSEQVETWPVEMQAGIKELADLAELAIFSNQSLSDEQESSAWNISSALISTARNSSTRLRRVIVPFMRVRL
jgi:lipoprotein signal peptidase